MLRDPTGPAVSERAREREDQAAPGIVKHAKHIAKPIAEKGVTGACDSTSNSWSAWKAQRDEELAQYQQRLDKHSKEIANLLAQKDYQGAHELEETFTREERELQTYGKEKQVTQPLQEKHDRQIAALLEMKNYKGAHELEEAFARDKQGKEEEAHNQSKQALREQHNRRIDELIAQTVSYTHLTLPTNGCV